DIAVSGAHMLMEQAAKYPQTDWHFEYSPETFSTAELEFSLEVCEAVMEVVKPTSEKPLILNLPATIEAAMPNVYADQIEWMCTHISARDSVVISLHPHNDRGTGVACAELAMLAGATRVEGCLFGNGERTGNVDLVTLALNLYTQGIYPNLDFSNLQQTANVMTYCNELLIHPRHPYAGELVFTAFSGSHQDAIKKGFAKRQENPNSIWNVPYFTIDPKDIGATYEAVIRVNSQSGKSGAAWLLETHHGIKLPRAFQLDFSQQVKDFTHQHEKEASMAEIWQLFKKRYGLNLYQPAGYQVQGFTGRNNANDYHLTVELSNPNELTIEGVGNGILSAFVNAINSHFDRRFSIEQYDEHSLGKASDSQAICYVMLKEDDESFYGVAIGDDVAKTSMQAVINACQQQLILG
ncbi:MAG: 2-isopropylmalate synthase, partial [Moraxella osloensis]